MLIRVWEVITLGFFNCPCVTRACTKKIHAQLWAHLSHKGWIPQHVDLTLQCTFVRGVWSELCPKIVYIDFLERKKKKENFLCYFSLFRCYIELYLVSWRALSTLIWVLRNRSNHIDTASFSTVTEEVQFKMYEKNCGSYYKTH